MDRRLGRGLGTLMGESSEIDIQQNQAELPIESILANPFQPRRAFDETRLRELADSLRGHGFLQPVVVRPKGPRFELISGERRWRAARLAGMAKIPAVIRRDVSDGQVLELALVENVQREDLDAIERARGFQSLIDAFGLTQEEVALKVGLQRATVANHLRLLELPIQVQEAVSGGLISMGHARAILGVPSAQQQLDLLPRIVREGLSVRRVEAIARNVQTESTARGKGRAPVGTLVPRPAWISDLERRLRDRFGTKIAIQNRRGYRGQIVIEYFDRSSLERLCASLAPIDQLT